MLGSIKSDQYWHWAAYGKHPAAKDYFRLGQNSPLVKSFSDWVENGYKTLVSKRNAGEEPFSWRFWARGIRKGTLVCGLVKDSSDSLGRPYPLLIMGTGHLKDWENQWDLLPFACEKTWGQIEYLSAQIVNNFKKLEVEVQNIRPPYSEWAEFNIKREKFIEFGASSDPKVSSRDLRGLGNQASSLSKKTEGFVCLDRKPFHDQFTLVSYWHFLFKARVKTVPNAIFMGGTFERAYLAFYKRPLMPADFIQLWSVSSEVRENGTLVVG